jgi:hypothetical protein
LGAHHARRIRLLAGGEVLVGGWEDAAVDPRGTDGGAIILELAEAAETLGGGSLVAIDLLENALRVWLTGDTPRLSRS